MTHCPAVRFAVAFGRPAPGRAGIPGVGRASGSPAGAPARLFPAFFAWTDPGPGLQR
jgi:hypothetical protein